MVGFWDVYAGRQCRSWVIFDRFPLSATSPLTPRKRPNRSIAASVARDQQQKSVRGRKDRKNALPPASYRSHRPKSCERLLAD
jgi:hypothetical protein